MTSVSTHILDTARGRPAAGVPVTLDTWVQAGWQRLAGADTGADGRIAKLATFGPPGPAAWSSPSAATCAPSTARRSSRRSPWCSIPSLASIITCPCC